MSSRKQTLTLVGLAAVCAVAGVAVVAPATPPGAENSAPTAVDTNLLAPAVPDPGTGRVIVEVDPPESTPEDGAGE